MTAITYDDFAKVDIRVGRIVQVDDFPKARKPAYKLTIDFGADVGIKRERIAGIGQAGTPDVMAGVTPGMRLAWPTVWGRTRMSFSCISRERPLTEW